MGKLGLEIRPEKFMKVKFADLSKINNLVKQEVLSAISNLIDSSSFVDGKTTLQFEEKFAEFCKAKYCVGVNSGTSAIHLAMIAANQKESYTKVALPANSFFATYAGAAYNNSRPYFIDIDQDNMNIDVDLLEKEHQNYDSIIPVSLYGNPCNLTRIRSIAEKHGKFVVHDACQAHGAIHNDKPICEYADLSCYSFYPSKNLGTFGEGGAIVTNDKELYDCLKQLKNHGQSKRYYHDILGYNYRLNEIQSAVLLIKLKYLDEWTNERIAISDRYNKNLSSSKVKTLSVNINDKCVYHLYPIFTDQRDRLIELFNQNNIEYGFHYPIPIYDQLALSYPFNIIDTKKYYPKTEYSKNCQISLPLYIGMTNDEIDYVSEIIHKL